MNKFAQLFRKVGGWKVLRQYLQAGVFLYVMVQTAILGFSKKALELVRSGVEFKLLKKLRKKNRKFISQFQESYIPQPQAHSNKIWVCWFQGMENAPALVQRCYRSLQENLPDREIILLTEDNYTDYVSFPQYILDKIASGAITRTHLSDLLRLELLIHHGGTWIDATVFCSGSNIPSYMLDADLFFFQILKPGMDGHSVCLSSWFMTACTNHPVLLLSRALLYRYWEKHNTMVDYFLLHDFFQLALEAYPQHWAQVIPFSSSTPHILLLRLFEPFNKQIWDAAAQATPFHKLSYKFTQDQADMPDTYYRHILL